MKILPNILRKLNMAFATIYIIGRVRYNRRELKLFGKGSNHRLNKGEE